MVVPVVVELLLVGTDLSRFHFWFADMIPYDANLMQQTHAIPCQAIPMP
jgi:hypothetical protein